MPTSPDQSSHPQVPAFQHWPGGTVALGFVAIQAPTMLPVERIDQLAEFTVKRMPDGLTGFTRIWGWQQYAQVLLDAFHGSVITYGHNLLDAQVRRLGDRAEFDRWIRLESPAGCIADMLRGWKACAESLAKSVHAPTHLAKGHVACLSCDWTGPAADDCPMCGGETGPGAQVPPAAQGLPAPAGHNKAVTDLMREIVAYCRESGHSWSSLDEADALLNLPPRRSLLPGWRFEQCGDGSIVIDGPTSAVVCNQVAKVDRKVPEEVLWELAHALVAENILGQGDLLDPPMPDAAPIKVAIPQEGDSCRVTMEFASPQEAEAFRQFFAQQVPVPDHKKWPPIPLSHCNPAHVQGEGHAQSEGADSDTLMCIRQAAEAAGWREGTDLGGFVRGILVRHAIAETASSLRAPIHPQGTSETVIGCPVSGTAQ